jgi:putative nucleotidyltransferase with HDIG domain
MRILVVDDELVSRMKMKKIMEGFGKCTEADTGERAIALFRNARIKDVPYDLITMDISMPDMDGIEALEKIREIEKAENVPQDMWVKVFMVTAHGDKDTIISSIRNGCNDYIMKPFSRQIITKKVLENGLIPNGTIPDTDEDEQQPIKQSRSLLDYVIEQFKNGEITLPSLSKIYAKFNELVQRNAQLQELAELLNQDPAISSKLISISNSSFYRTAAENKSLEQAVSILGMDVIKQTVDIISQKSLYLASNEKYAHIMESLWEHSLTCAHACLLVSEKLSRIPAKDLFTMGLLHDIGKLFLLQVVGEIEKKWQVSEAPSREELEEWLDEHHCRAGSTLLTKWNFPPEFIQVVLNHHEPEKTTVFYELIVVHISNEIVKSMGYTFASSKEVNLLENETIQKLGLTSQMIEDIKTKVKTQLEHFKESLEQA